jgi:hypothetical protein
MGGLTLQREHAPRKKKEKVHVASRVAAQKMLQERDEDMVKHLEKNKEREAKRLRAAEVGCSASFPTKVCSTQGTKLFAPTRELRKLAEKMFAVENVHVKTRASLELMICDRDHVKIWLVAGCAADEVQRSLVDLQPGGEDEYLSHICARAYGGYVADEEWLTTARDAIKRSKELYPLLFPTAV